jgi:hypothetical protein
VDELSKHDSFDEEATITATHDDCVKNDEE